MSTSSVGVGIQAAFRELGLWAVLPWAAGSGVLQLAAGGCLALAAAGGASPSRLQLAAMMLWLPLLGVGLLLAGVMGISGTRTDAPGGLLGGMAYGLAGTLLLGACQAMGAVGLVFELPAAAALGGTALCTGGAAALGVGWARARYGASPAGVAATASWALLVGLAPGVGLAAVRAWT